MKIGLLWHSMMSGNMGVRALTSANMRIIEEVAESVGVDVTFMLIGFGERVSSYHPCDGPAFYPLNLRNTVSPQGLWTALDDLDAVIDIGGGDSFAEIYGAKRFAFLWYSKLLVVCRGKPLILAPQTVGPFTRLPYRRLAAWIMKRAFSVIARDKKSYQLTRELAPSANAKTSIDVAFRLPYEDRSYKRGGVRRRVGVNVSGLLFYEAESGRNRFSLSYDYRAYTRELLASLSAIEDLDLFLVPHANSAHDESDDDGAVADRLAGEFPRFCRVRDFDGPSEAKSFISSLDFLVAARMHACIAAYSSGTPVLPVAYSRKFKGLFDMVEYDLVLPTTGLTASEAVRATLAALENSASLSDKIASGSRLVDELVAVYEQDLRRLFASLAEGSEVR